MTRDDYRSKVNELLRELIHAVSDTREEIISYHWCRARDPIGRMHAALREIETTVQQAEVEG